MFACPQCFKTFPKAEGLHDHRVIKHSRIPGSCPLCDARFPSRATLVNEHIIEHMLRCSTCGVGFTTEQGLQSHREKTGHEERPAFTCSHCEWICFNLEASQEHEADNHSIPCKHCEHQFATYATRDQHEALHLEYKCMYCDWEFSSEDTLDQHISDLHSSRCKYCGSQLSSITARNEHYKSCEYATPPCYTCTPCNRRFGSAAALDAHGTAKHRYGTRKRTVPSATSPTATSSQTAQKTSPITGGAPTGVPGHAGERSTGAGSTFDPEGQGAPDTQPDSGNIEVVTEEDQVASYCSSCRIVYESYEDSLTHTCKFVKTEIPLHCAYCYSRFVDGVSLVNHLAERDTFRCTVCNVQFCSENLLYDHLETHPQCRRCEESFADETELYRHMEVEHPVVVCWDCGGAVICQESLDLHYASEHPSCTICGSIMGSPDMLPEHLESEHGIVQAAKPDAGSSSVATAGVQTESVRSYVSDHHNICHSSQRSTSSFTSQLTQASLDGYITASSTLSVGSNDMVDSGADNSATRMQGFRGEKVSPTPSRSSRDFTPSHEYTEMNVDLSVEYAGAEDDHVQAINGNSRSLPSSSTCSPGEISPSASSVDAEPVADSGESVFEPEKGHKPPPGPPTRRELRLHCRICSRDPCEDMTATICGHLFCKRCITQAIVAKSECPVCKSATLLYCLFRLDLAA